MGQQLDVVYVEDDPRSIHLVEEAFAEAAVSAHVRGVPDAAAALALLAGGDDAGALRPDLVLLDIELGESSGLDVLAEMRATSDLRSPPVIVFTSSDDEADVATAYDRGANAFVQKPGDFEDLVAFVHAASDFWGPSASPAGATG